MASGVTNSLSCEFGDSEIIEIVSAEEYDSQRAKLQASIAWLASKAYGNQVPRDLKDPFYENSEGQLMLRPALVNLLSSSELYCVVCGKIFPETHTQWRGHWSIIQVLSRKGIYIADVQDTTVTETVLVQTAPFRLKAHLALMDALMRAYLSEVASVEKIVKAVRRITTFNASTELPSNPEEGLEFWVNKVGQALGAKGPVSSSEESQLIEGETNQKVRIVAKSPSPRETPRMVSVPPMEDLMRDIGDGCAIAAVIAYYRPSQLNVNDICLRSEIGIADSLYNLRQVGNFCKSHLPWSSFHLSYEDFLYTHQTMNINIYTFVADLFYFFEAPVKTMVGSIDAIPAAGRKSGQSIPSVPISNVTKKSFQKLPLEDTASNLGMSHQRSPASNTSGHQPLLARRAAAGGVIGSGSSEHQIYPSRRGRRVQSLSTPQERDQVYRSVIAWQDDQKLSASVPNHSALSDRNHPDYMEVESIHSTQSTRRTTPTTTPTAAITNVRNQSSLLEEKDMEPLMPAVLRPIKEKAMSKEEERGDKIARKKAMSSPQSPSLQHPVGGSAKDGSTNSSWSDETCVTPLALSADDKSMTMTPSTKRHEFDAFVVDPATMFDTPRFGDGPLSSSQMSSSLPSARSDAHSVAESYTIPDRPQTAVDAVRAGIPIVSDVGGGISPSSGRGVPSREGSVASSGEYSDHESLKIHQDHKNRESIPSSQSIPLQEHRSPERTTQGDEKKWKEGKLSLIITDQNTGDMNKTGHSTTTNTTNFAELKRLKDLKGLGPDKTGIQWDVNADGQPGQTGSAGSNVSQPGKPTVSFQSAPQTSWQQQQQQQQTNGSSSNGDIGADGGGSASSELQQLRLKLEQKRKEIERKKHRKEVQQNKMRQRLGKAAFMRVVSKHIDGQELESQSNAPSEPPPNSTHAQLQARLGHPGPRLPLSSSSMSTIPSATLSSSSSSSTVPTAQQLYLGGQGSGQEHRLTDWTAQSQLVRGNREKTQLPPKQQLLPSSSSHPVATTTTTVSQQRDLNGGASQFETTTSKGGLVNNSYNTLPASSSSNAQKTPAAMTKTFSREGIQQTIDNIKNKWFRNDDSDLLSTFRHESDEDAVDGDSYSQHHTHQSSPPTHYHTTPRPKSVSQSENLPSSNQHNVASPPFQGQFDTSVNSDYNNDPSYAMHTNTTRASSAPPVNIPVSSRAQHNHHRSDQDSSFDKLSCSLTDLQEEIMHMSLQNEQLTPTTTMQPGFNRDLVGMSDALAIIRGATTSPKPAVSTTSRPIHGIPHQAPYIRRSLTPSRQMDQQQSQPYQQPSVIGANSNNISVPYQHPSEVNTFSQNPQAFILSDEEKEPGLFPPGEELEQQDLDSLNYNHNTTPTGQAPTQDTDTIPKDGFFIAFGDDSQPRRPKPKLSDRTVCETPKKIAGDSSSTSSTSSSSAAATATVNNTPAQGLSALSVTPQALDSVDRARERSQSPHIGFMVTDPTDVQEKGGDSEMQKKKIKLLEMQRKRKEDQEKKRQEKEAEMARKQEEKMIKEEEQERKKADEKARRDVIFQQYMQKKTEDEEGGPPPPVKTRPERRSGSKPRPKSMFVKSKPMTPDPGAHGGRDSTSSSQEDLAGRSDGRHGSPSLMSVMRSSYHFRPPGGKISMRKSVSCNTLPQNGGTGSGASTYRRPPSPDLYRIRQQRQRGNSQDSGSDAGSGSNPGSDYAGPKLFVKPSAKSNRHILVNAISHCCLAGSVNTDTKNKVLQEMSKCDANHFLILFRDASCKYRGLFIFYPETEEAFKVHGIGPKHITNDMCEKFYKYNSGGKSFNQIVSTKHLSVSVDAVVLLGSVWKTGKAAVRR